MRTATMTKVQRQYLETALWSTTDVSGKPLDDDYGINDIPNDLRAEMLNDLDAFMDDDAVAEAAGTLGLDDSDVAHLFWLTREHHGAGFQDYFGQSVERDAAVNVLRAAAHAYGTQGDALMLALS